MPDLVTAACAHVREQHGVLILKNRHRLIRELHKTSPQPTLHGHQIWQSGFMIMEYLLQHPLGQGQQVLEVGCGWGLLGIFCVKHFTAEVTSLDADELVFPYLNAHAQVNNVTLRTLHQRFTDITDDELLTSDVLLGSDICYWDTMVNELQVLITRALAAGVRKIIIADPGRETFSRLASHCKTHFAAELLPWELEGRRRNRGYLLIIDNVFLA